MNTFLSLLVAIAFILNHGAISSNVLESTKYPGSYLVDNAESESTVKFHELDPVSGDAVLYQIVPLKNSRNKRQVTIPNDNNEEASAVQQSPPAKDKNNNGNNATLVPLEHESVYPHDPYIDFENDLLNEEQYISQQHLNRTDEVEFSEDHKYYNSTFYSDGMRFWVDLSKLNNTITHEMLSNAHRRAATIKLGFDFPFYGYNLSSVTVATGGFIYMGDQVHAWLAATQYVAPLMANFDSSGSPDAALRYYSDSNQFTVEWDNFELKDANENRTFTFQTSLYLNGTIAFVYKDIPVMPKDVNDTHHPVKVGLSDAYIRDRHMLFVKQKTIYEYHRADFKDHEHYNISNGTAIIFRPLPTCISFNTCFDCVEGLKNTSFECGWCEALNRCSDGTDRMRQDWVQKSCDKDENKVTDKNSCPIPGRKISQSTSRPTSFDDRGKGHYNSIDIDDHHQRLHGDEVSMRKVETDSSGMSTGGVIGVLILVMLILTSIGWVAYAYIFPHSPSGQLLIRYRPTQWAFRRGEARYTAASIHM